VKRVVVIGAGMTGLACAYALRDRAEVVVLEGSDRVGGNVRTERDAGFVMDAGPDGWLVTKPEATRLAREIGLDDELIGTIAENRRVYVAWNSRLHAMPEGVVLGVPTRIAPMIGTRLFSLRGKARMALEPLVPRARHDDDDESVGAFVARRLGREARDRLAAPLLGGIFAGDANTLSVRAAFPQLVEQERKYGSLILAMRATRPRASARSGAAGKGSAFLSLRSGMSKFPETLARAIASFGDVRSNVRVASISRANHGYEIATSNETLHADEVVLATPPRDTAKLLRALDADASRTCDAIRCGSSAAIFIGLRRKDVAHPLDASGFVVPRTAKNQLVACTFVSSKWENRAPEGHVLLRAFLGGAGRESALDASDDALVDTARRELAALLGDLGDPVMTRVFRHVLASPQPEIGHLARMTALDERLRTLPGVHVVGNGYHGTGIPDCIKQARAVAAKI
jgi:oxygen-dependent protoporphyrinogen oxidase